jgi:hypothetical protein
MGKPKTLKGTGLKNYENQIDKHILNQTSFTLKV